MERRQEMAAMERGRMHLRSIETEDVWEDALRSIETEDVWMKEKEKEKMVDFFSSFLYFILIC